MFGIFMGRWKLKEVMIKMENNKTKFNDDLQVTEDKLSETQKKLKESEANLSKAHSIIEDYDKRLKKLEEAGNML